MANNKIKEGIEALYKDGEFVALVKRDDISRKHLIYLVKEATSSDIAELFAGDGFNVVNLIKQNEE